jgi:hypothetical protein
LRCFERSRSSSSTSVPDLQVRFTIEFFSRAT